MRNFTGFLDDVWYYGMLPSSAQRQRYFHIDKNFFVVDLNLNKNGFSCLYNVYIKMKEKQ